MRLGDVMVRSACLCCGYRDGSEPGGGGRARASGARQRCLVGVSASEVRSSKGDGDNAATLQLAHSCRHPSSLLLVVEARALQTHRQCRCRETHSGTE